MPRTLPIVVSELLEKAKSSALLAVEIYNRPLAEFRIQSFVVHMQIAWTAALLATLIRRGEKPYYREKDGRTFVRVNGERMAWSLEQCIQQVWPGDNGPVVSNIRFFVRLRDKIEHYRDQAALGALTFGECQSLVTNFEEFVAAEYGPNHSLSEGLALSIQLSRLRDEAKDTALINQSDRATKNVLDFIQAFRSALSDDVYSDMRFSHQVFLFPKSANHKSREAMAVEWLDPSALSGDERAAAERAIGLIKRRDVPVRNLQGLKPGAVCEAVRDALGIRPFSPSYQHVLCWRYYDIRPESGAADPKATDARYCSYDEVHGDYVYTDAWVEFLISQLGDPARRGEILAP